MFEMKAVGNRIRELRMQRGLTQNAFADALNVSFQAVSNWERGIAAPELEHLIHMAEYFGVLVDDILRPKKTDLFLGVDGGGTKTEFALVSSDGYVLKRVTKGGCNPNSIGYAKMAALLVDTTGDLLGEFPSITSVFCGIAGITTGDHAKQLYTAFKKRYPQLHVQIQSDSFNLFALDEAADMAMISGTGSVVFVKKGDAYVRLGGWGYLLDGAGSAFGIGQDALCEALREEDMLESPSLLCRMLRQRLGSATVWAHTHTIYQEGSPYIAALASVVFEAYRAGDEKAIRIIDRNAKALAELLNAGVALHGARPIAIASGGIFEHYKDIMAAHIAKYSCVKLHTSDLPPIYGACKKACALAGTEIPDAFYDHFKKSYGGITP